MTWRVRCLCGKNHSSKNPAATPPRRSRAACTGTALNRKQLFSLRRLFRQPFPLDQGHDVVRSLQRGLDLTTAEVVAHLKGDWSADVAAYDKVHEHILMLADQLSDGIVAQFPESAHAQ